MFALLILLLMEPVAVIDSVPAELFLQPEKVAVSGNGSYFVLTKEQKVMIFDDQFQLSKVFGVKGQGPGELELATDLVWLEETQELWINDFMQRRIAVFNESGQFIRNIKLSTPSNSFLKTEEHIVLCPPGHDIPFVVVDFEGVEQYSFSTEFEFSDAIYERSIWQMAQPIQLADNRIGLGYIFANKISVFNADGTTFRALDMDHYYDQYPNPRNLPLYFSQASIFPAEGDQLWVLTCSNNDQTCTELLRINYKTGNLTGRADADYDIRCFQQLENGMYAAIDRENATVRIYEDFPFEIKERQNPPPSSSLPASSASTRADTPD
jgi:hypothetical protein